MQSAIHRHTQPGDAQEALVTFDQFLSKLVRLYSTQSALQQHADSNTVAFDLMVALPANKAWAGAVHSIVPQLRAFIVQVKAAGKVASSDGFTQDKAQIVAGRLSDYALNLVLALYWELNNDVAAYTAFYEDFMRERAVL